MHQHPGVIRESPLTINFVLNRGRRPYAVQTPISGSLLLFLCVFAFVAYALFIRHNYNLVIRKTQNHLPRFRTSFGRPKPCPRIALPGFRVMLLIQVKCAAVPRHIVDKVGLGQPR